MSAEGNFVLRWDLHQQTVASTLQSMWKNDEFLDVTIASDDGQINAHKFILSAASPFFQTVLKHNPHSHPLLYLRGTTKKDIQSLLDFIYSGEAQIHHEELDNFMSLANSLQVRGLEVDVSDMKIVTDEEYVELMGIETKKIESDELLIEDHLVTARKD